MTHPTRLPAAHPAAVRHRFARQGWARTPGIGRRRLPHAAAGNRPQGGFHAEALAGGAGGADEMTFALLPRRR